jgi:diaminopimelate decarboxylase
MQPFHYENDALLCEQVCVADVAERFGTPCYLYSAESLTGRYRAVRDAFAEFAPLICFSVKSNGNLALLQLLGREGSGFDVVSGGEIYRVLQAGGAPEGIVYAGVGKTEEEIRFALETGIHMFNCESPAEARTIERLAAETGSEARLALRINPDVDARTHPKTTTGKKETKFGISPAQALELVEEARDWAAARIRGIHLHLGSPIYSAEPYVAALERMLEFIPACRERGAPVDTLNIGGGYCIGYTGESVMGPADYAAAVAPLVRRLDCRLILEPGRFISGPSGILLTRVVYTKTNEAGKKFLICDAGMNDLIRPTLYEAFQRIWPVSGPAMPPVLGPETTDFGPVAVETVDVVGPVCETGDYLALGRALPPVEAGALLAVWDAGAYGFSMASNYNARPRPCEVLVQGGETRLIRKRESFRDIVGTEPGFLV